MTTVTVEKLLDRAEAAVRKSKAVDLWRPSDARVQAEELLGEALGRDITSDDLDAVVPAAARRRFEAMVARRVRGEPVALILGKIEFRGLWLEVRRGVFIPRSSSELLAEKAIRRLAARKSRVAVDVATGTGPVALAVAHEVRRSKVYGVDISPLPLRVARENARRLRIRNVEFIRSDLLARLPRSLRGRVDVFTLHPPYVGRRYLRTLPREITDFEPYESITDASDDGLELVRRLLAEAPEWLRRGGWLLIEVSPDLSRRVGGLLRRQGFRDVRSQRDSLGATRVVSGRL